eukprot:gene8819-biopygen8214
MLWNVYRIPECIRIPSDVACCITEMGRHKEADPINGKEYAGRCSCVRPMVGAQVRRPRTSDVRTIDERMHGTHHRHTIGAYFEGRGMVWRRYHRWCEPRLLRAGRRR